METFQTLRPKFRYLDFDVNALRIYRFTDFHSFVLLLFMISWKLINVTFYRENVPSRNIVVKQFEKYRFPIKGHIRVMQRLKGCKKSDYYHLFCSASETLHLWSSAEKKVFLKTFAVRFHLHSVSKIRLPGFEKTLFFSGTSHFYRFSIF